jgi:hypothetical protein
MICFFSVLLYLKQQCRDDYREFELFGGYEFNFSAQNLSYNKKRIAANSFSI